MYRADSVLRCLTHGGCGDASRNEAAEMAVGALRALAEVPRAASWGARVPSRCGISDSGSRRR
eukprot:7594239-Alexandrium_andersonii.AAC.1